MATAVSITKRHKDGWVEMVGNRIRDKRRLDLVEGSMEFAQMIYASAVSPEVRKTMDSLPKGSFLMTIGFQVSRSGYYSHRDQDVGAYFNRDKKPVPVPHLFWGSEWRYRNSFSLNSIENALSDGYIKPAVAKRLTTALEKLLTKAEAIEKEVNEFTRNAHAVLSSIRNSNQLRKNWPDIAEDFLKYNQLNNADKAQLPAIPMAGLNAIVQEYQAIKMAANPSAGLH